MTARKPDEVWSDDEMDQGALLLLYYVAYKVMVHF